MFNVENNVQRFNQATIDTNAPEIAIPTDVANKDLSFPLGLVKIDTAQQQELADRIFYYEGSDYILHQKNCEANRDYYFNKQWTKAEQDANTAKGQYTLTLNKIRKAINSMTGMFSANKPRYSVMPSGNEDESMAAIANKLLDYIWHKSDGLNTVRNVCMAGLRDNVGYFIVSTDINGDVKFDYADYTEVVVDPRSKDPLFKDSEWIYYKKWVPVSTIKELYGIDVSTSSRPVSWSNRYSSDKTDFIKIGQLIDDFKMHACIYEGQKITWVKQVDGTFRKQVRKQTILGYDYVYNQIMPASITDRSIIPFYTEYTGNPYVKGETFFLMEYQDFINKAFGVTLLNAQLHGNPKVFMWDKTLKSDQKEAEQHYANPGSITILNSEAGQGTNLENLKPIVVQGQPLPTSWFQLLQMIMGEMEINSLPNDVMGYKDSTSPQQQQLFERREAIMDSLKLALGHFDNALTQLGKVNLQYAKAFMNKKKMFRVIDGEGKTLTLVQNLQRGFDPTDDSSIARFREQEKKNNVSEIDIESKLAKAKNDADYAKSIQLMYSDLDAMDVDLTLVVGSYSPNYEASQWGALMAMRGNGVNIDDEDVIQVSPVQNRSVIAQKSSQNAQMRSQNRALQEENSYLTQQLDELRNQMIGIQYQAQVAEGQHKVDKIVTDARYKERYNIKTGQQRVQNYVTDAQHKIDLQLNDAIHDIENLDNAIKESGKQAGGATLADILRNPMLINMRQDATKPFSSQLPDNTQQQQ